MILACANKISLAYLLLILKSLFRRFSMKKCLLSLITIILISLPIMANTESLIQSQSIKPEMPYCFYSSTLNPETWKQVELIAEPNFRFTSIEFNYIVDDVKFGASVNLKNHNTYYYAMIKTAGNNYAHIISDMFVLEKLPQEDLFNRDKNKNIFMNLRLSHGSIACTLK